jgi:hypothetical protein
MYSSFTIQYAVLLHLLLELTNCHGLLNWKLQNFCGHKVIMWTPDHSNRLRYDSDHWHLPIRGILGVIPISHKTPASLPKPVWELQTSHYGLHSYCHGYYRRFNKYSICTCRYNKIMGSSRERPTTGLVSATWSTYTLRIPRNTCSAHKPKPYCRNNK